LKCCFGEKNSKEGARYMSEQVKRKAVNPIYARASIQNPEREVLHRYEKGARQVEGGLCCPTGYNKKEGLIDFDRF
jgi:hypothetical protein